MAIAVPKGYYSSEEKNIVRQQFDLPLLVALRQRSSGGLRYFGLPGSQVLDLKAWKPLITHVEAVERRRDNLEEIEQALETQFPDVRYTTHWGDVDEIILANRGKKRIIGGQRYRPWVRGFYAHRLGGHAWNFDIVNLDYFGPFLPPDAPAAGGRARLRADALRKLFDLERQDAWKRWVLLVTVEAQLIGQPDRDVLKAYLGSVKKDSSAEIADVLDFLLNGTSGSVEEATRLVHGVTAMMVAVAASNANLRVLPRGTVLYRGAHDQPMIHIGYEFEPVAMALGELVSRLVALRAPVLQIRNPPVSPWFELLPEQPPGLTNEDIRHCLDFLKATWIEEIVGQ